MSPSWNVTFKPSALVELLALPVKEMSQVQAKIADLCRDPAPDGKARKRIQGIRENLCRLRSGDYRVFYTFNGGAVSVLSVRIRNEDTFDRMPEAESLEAGDTDLDVTAVLTPRGRERAWVAPPTKSEATPLRTPFTAESLRTLRIPEELHARLAELRTAEEVMELGGVPPDIHKRLLDAALGCPLDQVVTQPDLVVPEPEDLMRWREGELIGFLLKLTPEQEEFVTRGLGGTGPMLLKGGPGTGKSTVALYRARHLVRRLTVEGEAKPRLLFTTFTHALVSFSRQLLDRLLGDDSVCVEVRTADSVAFELAASAHEGRQTVGRKEVRPVLKEVLAQGPFAGNSLEIAAQAETVRRLGEKYLLEEVLRVIEGRGLATFEQYQAAARPGRRVALNAGQRKAVWAVREALVAALGRRSLITFEQIRGAAAERIRLTRDRPYDAVLIDEAQDLDPVLLETLVRSSEGPDRVFLTADVDQSIYGAGFRWSDVHESLKFRGRTGILRTNFRSTREIGEAARSYLGQSGLDQEPEAPLYEHEGPLPVVRAVRTVEAESALLVLFLRQAARDLRFGPGSCAVFVPTEKAGRRVAATLAAAGMPAAFTPGKDLDLASAGVKVMTLRSSKGLEFPIVALAGFLDGPYPMVRPGTPADEVREFLDRERRTMYVAMTRAMRALLVVVPEGADSGVLNGFDDKYWNMRA